MTQTQSIDEFKDELVDHKRNKEAGVATIGNIRECEDSVEFTFELPRGNVTFTETFPDTEEVWASFYELTDTGPPCIDVLHGESVPVEWNDDQSEWELAVSIPFDDLEDEPEPRK